MQGRKEIIPKMLYQVHLDGKQKKQKILDKFIGLCRRAYKLSKIYGGDFSVKTSTSLKRMD
jgi:translation elongation factor EF-4